MKRSLAAHAQKSVAGRLRGRQAFHRRRAGWRPFPVCMSLPQRKAFSRRASPSAMKISPVLWRMPPPGLSAAGRAGRGSGIGGFPGRQVGRQKPGAGDFRRQCRFRHRRVGGGGFNEGCGLRFMRGFAVRHGRRHLTFRHASSSSVCRAGHSPGCGAVLAWPRGAAIPRSGPRSILGLIGSRPPPEHRRRTWRPGFDTRNARATFHGKPGSGRPIHPGRQLRHPYPLDPAVQKSGSRPRSLPRPCPSAGGAGASSPGQRIEDGPRAV